MLKTVKKANLFSKNRLYNRNINDRRNQLQYKRLSASRGAGTAAEIEDAPLLTTMPAYLMLARYLGHFCCFYANGAPRTPQLFSPSLRLHEKRSADHLSSSHHFLPDIIFPLYNGQNSLFSCWKQVHILYRFQYRQ